MIITYFGEQFFKIALGDLVLAFNPVNKNSKSGISAYFGADIAFSSVNYSLYNGVNQLCRGDRKPFIINGPGDYEVKEIFVKGIMSDVFIDKKKYINTIYSLTLDGVKLIFLGALGNSEISKDVHEAINGPDILFIPIGGSLASKEVGLLDAKESAKLSLSLEAKLIIPMSYNESVLKIFLKEMGEEEAEATEKLTIKAKDLEDKEGEVIILKTANGNF